MNISQYSAWISYCNSIRRNVLCHHRSCTDDHIVTDSYAGTYCYICPQPGVITYGDGTVIKAGFQAFFGIDGMIGTDKCAAGAYQSVCSYGDGSGVKEGAAEVQHGHTLKVWVPAETALKSRLNE